MFGIEDGTIKVNNSLIIKTQTTGTNRTVFNEAACCLTLSIRTQLQNPVFLTYQTFSMNAILMLIL